MNTDASWFTTFRTTKEYALLFSRPIAYFCAEYAFFEHGQTYAGGLGVLAGDFLREAADQQLPVVAVGLYYQNGYLHHDAFSADVVLRHTIAKTPEAVGLIPVLTDTGDRLIVSVPYSEKAVFAQVWLKKMGSVSLYLLDTNVSQNDIAQQSITERLYPADKEMRFKQEMLLGIGGMRVLQALHINPIVYHLNEGHSALLVFEIAHHEMQRHGKGFMEELQQAKQRIIFTNHTLTAAGNDTFSKEMVSALLMRYAEEIQVPSEELVSLGVVKDTSIFSLTTLALRMASKVNAVSKLHAIKAKEIWPDNPMVPITNGIHIQTWDTIQDDERVVGKQEENKKALLSYITEKTGVTWDEKTLLLGWARRMTSYKRPLALFEDANRFATLSTNTSRPIKVVLSGQSHETDDEGAHMLKKLQELITTSLNGSVVYLPDYTVSIAKMLVCGTDVWLNTPVVGFEACGTSGMKAALNGSLPASTKDGWVDEENIYGIGWVLDSEHVNISLLDILEQQILPMYYDGKAMWSENMKHARQLIKNEFSTTKMLRKYIEILYKDAIDTQHTL